MREAVTLLINDAFVITAAEEAGAVRPSATQNCHQLERAHKDGNV